MPHRALALLLVEHQSLIRSTVASVARQLDLAQIDEASSLDAAELRLTRQRYDALLLSIDERPPAMRLLHRVREGEFKGSRELAILAMSDHCDTELAAELKRFEVRRLLLKPFKVKLLLQSIEALVDELHTTETT